MNPTRSIKHLLASCMVVSALTATTWCSAAVANSGSLGIDVGEVGVTARVVA
jgi:hypothetical protein